MQAISTHTNFLSFIPLSLPLSDLINKQQKGPNLEHPITVIHLSYIIDNIPPGQSGIKDLLSTRPNHHQSYNQSLSNFSFLFHRYLLYPHSSLPFTLSYSLKYFHNLINAGLLFVIVLMADSTVLFVLACNCTNEKESSLWKLLPREYIDALTMELS